MGGYKERTDNPLHRQFGAGRNTVYILKKIRQYCPVVIPLAILGIVGESAVSYYWGIVGKFVIDMVQTGLDSDNTEALIRLLLIAGVIAGVLTFCWRFSSAKIWYRYIFVRQQMITERVDKALCLNYEMLERPDVLDVHQRAMQATGGNDNGVEGMMHLMQALGTRLVTVAVTFVAVLVVDWRLIGCLIALGILQFWYHLWTIKTDKAEVWDKLSPVWRQLNYMSRVTQDFDYAKDIRLFDLSGFLVGKQQAVFEKKQKRMKYHFELWFRHAAVSQICAAAGKAAVYAVLVAAVLRGSLSIGDFTMFLAFAVSFSENLAQFLHRFGDYRRASLEVDDFRSFVEMKDDEPADAVPVPAAQMYTIEFHNVSYRYLKQEKNAVENLNLTLHPGEKLAVVGLNGAGKTTMIKLLLRLYDPTEGYITLNGIDIRRFGRADYYRIFSPVFQNIELMAFPVAEHVSMRTAQETDRRRAETALEEAGLMEKLRTLPKGIDTELLKIVDEEGIDLSGGEQQKLALARALYKAAPVVVLDEPTSALDALAEQQLYERFDHMIGKKSAVYISHRLASTRFCDKIALFMDGRMVEYGSHEELMERGGEYTRMFTIQAQYYREDQEKGAGRNGKEE